MSLIILHHDGPISYVTLNRPEVRNAFNDQLLAEIKSCLQQIEKRDETRVVVIAGAGDFFCAGADLNWMKSFMGSSRKVNEADAKRLGDLLLLLNRLSKPTIARVQGAAIGGGVGLLAACDIVVATTQTVFALAEVKLGLIPAVISPFVLSKMSCSAARRYFLTGERFSAEKALQFGLIHEVVPSERLDETVATLSRELVTSGPAALRSCKELIEKVDGWPFSPALQSYTVKKIASLRVSEEGQEGIRAFLEKRKPSWISKLKMLLIGLALVTSLFPSKVLKGQEAEKEVVETATEKALRLFGVRPGEVMSLSLKECVRRALIYHPDIQAAEYGIATAQEKGVEASRIGYPILDYEYTLAPVPQDVSNAMESFFGGDLTVLNRFKLGVGVPLNTFGKVKVGKALAETGVRAEKERQTQKKTEIVFKVKQLYYGILLAREVNRLLVSAGEGVESQIQKREAEEGTNPSELLKLKLFRAELKRKIEEGDKKEILAKEALRVQLGLDANARYDLAADKLRPATAVLKSYQAYREKAFKSRNDLNLLNLGYTAKEQQLKLEKRMMAPNLSLGGFFEIGRAPNVTGVTTTDDFSDPFNFTRAGIGLQLKGQFDFHAGLSKIRQARSDLYKLGVQQELAERGIDLEVKEAFLDVTNTKLDMERAEEAGRLSRQLLFLTQSSYDIGLAEPKDLIEGISSFLQTRGQYFEAIFNYNVAVAKLDQKIGQLEEN